MRVRVDAIGAIGLVADIADTETPPNVWTAVDNVRFRRGKAEPMLGYTVAYTATGVAHYLVGVDVGGAPGIDVEGRDIPPSGGEGPPDAPGDRKQFEEDRHSPVSVF